MANPEIHPIEMDFGGVDPNKVGEQNTLEFATKPGRCHVGLVGAEFDTAKSVYIFKWEIFAHEDADQMGRVQWDRLNHPSPSHKDGGDFARQTLFAYAIALGLYTQSQLASMAAAKQKITLNFAGREGTQAFMVLRSEDYEGKTRIKTVAIYGVHDERAKSFPRNAGMLAKAGGPAPTATPTPAPSPAANPFAKKV